MQRFPVYFTFATISQSQGYGPKLMSGGASCNSVSQSYSTLCASNPSNPYNRNVSKNDSFNQCYQCTNKRQQQLSDTPDQKNTRSKNTRSNTSPTHPTLNLKKKNTYLVRHVVPRYNPFQQIHRRFLVHRWNSFLSSSFTVPQFKSLLHKQC